MAHIQQVAELLARGELEPSHPWPAALLWRRVRDLREIALVLNDDALQPLLDLSCAPEVLRAVASSDPSGRLDLLADALEKVESQDEFDILVRRGLMSEAEAAHSRRRIEFELAAGQHTAPTESRQRSRWRRCLLAQMEHLEYGARAWPDGRGRRPGSEGTKVRKRRGSCVGGFRGRRRVTKRAWFGCGRMLLERSCATTLDGMGPAAFSSSPETV